MSKKNKLISRFLLLGILNYQAAFSVLSTEFVSLTTTTEPTVTVNNSMTVIQITNDRKKKQLSTAPQFAMPLIARQETKPSYSEHSQLGKRMARLSGILLYGERGGKT